MQEQYWIRLTQYKFSIYYFDAYIARNVKINRFIKILTAVLSSSAIAAWVNWAQYAFFWGFIIAISQVISAVNEIMPYRNRVKELSRAVNEFSVIYVEMESDWYNVASGSWTENEINKKLYEYVSRWSEIETTTLSDDYLSQDIECFEFAEKQKNDYFEKHFGV